MESAANYAVGRAMVVWKEGGYLDRKQYCRRIAVVLCRSEKRIRRRYRYLEDVDLEPVAPMTVRDLGPVPLIDTELLDLVANVGRRVAATLLMISRKRLREMVDNAARRVMQQVQP